MKKLLAILWLIIVVGGVIILLNFFGPKSGEVIDQIDSQDLTKVSFDADDFKDLVREGDEYFTAKKYKEASQKYLAASEMNPNSAAIQFKLGQSLQQIDKSEQAVNAFYKAFQLDPNPAYGLAVSSAALKTSDPETLSKNLEKAKIALAKLDQKSPEVKYSTALILILYKDFETAKKLFAEVNDTNSQKFLKQFETFSSFKEGSPLFLETLLAQTFTSVKEYQAAIFLCYDVIKQQKNYRDAWIILGYNYLKTNQAKEAVDALTQAKALDPENPNSLFYLGAAYAMDSQTKEAILFLKLAEKNDFEPLEEIYLKLGDLYLLQKDYDKSAEYYRKLIAANTSSLGAFVRLIWLEIEKLDNPDQAVHYADIALKEHPEDAMSYNLKGWALTSAGEFKEAKEYLAKALNLQKDFDAAYLNFGWLYEKEGNTTLARKYYEKAFVLGNGNSIGKTAGVRLNEIKDPNL